MRARSSKDDQAFFAKLYNPYVQAGIIYACILLFSAAGSAAASDTFPWLVSTSFLLFFAIFNAICSLTAKSINKYWGQSITAFLVLGGLGILTAWGISGVTIDEAGSYRWLYFVLGFTYLVFLCMLAFMKNIVDFAQREEWNQPRRRRRRK